MEEKMEQSFKQTLGLGKDKSIQFIKGIVLGMGMILPGVSGGTLIMAFGMYEILLEDLLKFRFKAYILFGLGTLMGIFVGSSFVGYMLEFYNNPSLAFILGCLLMSIPLILKKSQSFSKVNVVLFIMGGILAYILIQLPSLTGGGPISIKETFLAGFIASGTMIIPGVSGSGVLIIMGFYENVLSLLNSFNYKYLFVFSVGTVLGLGLLAQLLRILFKKHQSKILFLFSGLILGSSPMLFPKAIDLPSVISFFLGLALVYKFGGGSR